MALTKNAVKNTPAFEAPDDENDGDTAVELSPAERLKAAADERAAAAKPASTSTAVATKAAGQVAVAKALIDPLKALENAFPVEYDTLRNLLVTNGNVMDKDTSKPLGDIIGLELLSYQSQWVVSPGVDGDEAKEHVRYSDDGVTTTQGEDCNEYLQSLKSSGFPEAKKSERVVIVGSVFEPGKLKDLKDSLVQINLPPTSKAAFQRYRLDQAFQVGKGKIDAEGAERIKIECSLVTKGKMTWTVATFTRWAD